jgi:transcription initiation factor TFIID subunit 3
MLLLATSTANFAALNHDELEITVEDVRMALQECAAIVPEKVWEDQVFDGEEDTRGVDLFIEWATGPVNKEIKRIALEGGEEAKEDYLTGNGAHSLPLPLADYWQH